MNIFLFDPLGSGYDPQSPLRQPMGGTESAAAYLCAALVRQGANVFLANSAERDHVVDGVQVLSNGAAAYEALQNADFVIVLAMAAGQRIRPQVPAGVPMVLWCHLAADQSKVAPLSEKAEQDSWSGFVMVSQWQVENYVGMLGVPAERAHVIGNAVSPAVAARDPGPAWYETGKPPVLIYTSTPFRGLDHLLMSFPSIKARVPDVTLKVYSAMKLYGQTEADPFECFYELARALDGVEYKGVVSQAQLAEEIHGTAALTYPSVFAETSCIAVMEAMAAGAEILTTELGALPETMHGFGQAMPIHGLGVSFINPYVDMVVNALETARANPEAAARRRRQQTEFVREHYVWDARARQWLALAEELIAKEGARSVAAQ